MVNLKLDEDEGIVLQTDYAERYTPDDEDTDINEMYLTNKNIIINYDKSIGKFKTESAFEYISLKEIKVVNKKVQVFKVDDEEYGYGLKIFYKNGNQELYLFDKDKDVDIWYKSIIETLTGESIATVEDSKTKEKSKRKSVEEIIDNSNEKVISATKSISDSTLSLMSGMKKVIDSTKSAFDDLKNQKNNDKVKQSNIDSKYCSNCGSNISEKSKFCESCGYPVDGNNDSNKVKESFEKDKIIENDETTSKNEKDIQQNQEDEVSVELNERKIVYDGKIHKCPNCGEVVRSLEIKCPSCGFELNNKNVSKTLNNFIEKVNNCEETIINSNSSSGWKSWGGGKKFGFILLNMMFAFIPLVLYFLLPLIKIKSRPKMTKEEEQLEKLIENFPFPNDRESIIEAFLFAKEKMEFISKKDMTQKNAYWIRLWSSKAEQLKNKADTLFPNDSIVNQNYVSLKQTELNVNKKLRIKAILGIILMIAAIIFLGNRFELFDNLDLFQNHNSVIEWQDTTLFNMLPRIDKNGKVTSESEKSIHIEVYGVSSDEFNAYVNECRKMGFNEEVTKTDSVFYSKTYDKYDLDIFYDKSKKIMKIYHDSYNVTNPRKNTSPKLNVDESDISSFINGYEKAEFNKFNSFASDNGLGGTKIYFKGVIEKVEIFEAEDTKSIVGYVKDESGNTWFVQFHAIPLVNEKSFDKYVSESIYLRGVYEGYSSVKKMPYVVMDEIFIIKSGEIVSGLNKVIN